MNQEYTIMMDKFWGNKLNKTARLTILDDKTYKSINENIINH